jgi:hypothetical protein
MRGTSPILVTAALSIAALVSVAGFRVGTMLQTPVATTPRIPVEAPTYVAIEDSDGNGVPDWQDELARAGINFSTTTKDATTSPTSSMTAAIAQTLYGGYLSLKQSGDYSPDRAAALAETVASNIRAPEMFTPHTVDELQLTKDVSETRILEYRSDMRTATAPLVNDEPPELDLVAQYLLSKDASWLIRLAEAATRYRETEKNMLALTVPSDAAPEHLRVLNALGAYAATLEALSEPVSDSLGSVALIKSLNEGEAEILYASDALAKYYVRSIN